jgi:hypothetical protein
VTHAEDGTVEPKPPSPVCKSFLICQRIIEDIHGHDHVLIAPTLRHEDFQYPAVVNLAVFALWTSAHGLYTPEIQLQDLEGQVLWRQIYSPPLDIASPLESRAIIFHKCTLVFPRPGKYDVVMVANGDELIRTVFWAEFARPQM